MAEDMSILFQRLDDGLFIVDEAGDGAFFGNTTYIAPLYIELPTGTNPQLFDNNEYSEVGIKLEDDGSIPWSVIK